MVLLFNSFFSKYKRCDEFFSCVFHEGVRFEFKWIEGTDFWLIASLQSLSSKDHWKCPTHEMLMRNPNFCLHNSNKHGPCKWFSSIKWFTTFHILAEVFLGCLEHSMFGYKWTVSNGYRIYSSLMNCVRLVNWIRHFMAIWYSSY